MRFEFATAGRIIFGPGTLNEAGPFAREFGSRVLVIHGRGKERAERLFELLAGQGLSYEALAIAKEPCTSDVAAGVDVARQSRAELVIGFGGGSVIDTAKAIAGVATNEGTLMDYLEVIGGARPLPNPGLPCIAIPTTAGTGAEVTRNSVIASLEHRVKVSIRSPHLLPRIAIIDPELTYDLPPAITATTGMDALTQVIEPFVSGRANPLTDALCLEGMKRAARSLKVAFCDGKNAAAREDMAVASLFGGLALANAGLGAVHGFAGPIGGMFPDAPHGAVCAALLPHVMKANAIAVRDSGSATRFETVARILTGRDEATVEDGVRWIQQLAAELQIPSLGVYGIRTEHIPALVEAGARASSMKANPVKLHDDCLAEILRTAIQ